MHAQHALPIGSLATTAVTAAAIGLASVTSAGAQQARTIAPVAPNTVVGVVVDTLGRPMDSVQISIRTPRREVYSRPDGTFRIDSVPAGPVDLTARKIGFRPQGRRVTVGKNGAAVQFDLTRLVRNLPVVVTEARRTGLSGVVGDTAYHAIPGAVVHVLGSGAGVGITDSAGAFYIDAKPGHYMAQVRAAGYQTQLLSVTLPKDEGRRVSVLMMPGRATRAAREAVYLDNLRDRLVRRSPAYSRIFTREDIAKMGSINVQQLATMGAIRRVDESCDVVLDGGMDWAPLWALDVDDIEMLEVYERGGGRSRAPRPGTSISRGSTAPIRTQGSAAASRGGLGGGNVDCPATVIAWMRK